MQWSRATALTGHNKCKYAQFIAMQWQSAQSIVAFYYCFWEIWFFSSSLSLSLSHLLLYCVFFLYYANCVHAQGHFLAIIIIPKCFQVSQSAKHSKISTTKLRSLLCYAMHKTTERQREKKNNQFNLGSTVDFRVKMSGVRSTYNQKMW